MPRSFLKHFSWKRFIFYRLGYKIGKKVVMSIKSKSVPCISRWWHWSGRQDSQSSCVMSSGDRSLAKEEKTEPNIFIFDEEANTMMLLSSSFWIICPWWEKGCLRMSPQVYLCPMSRDNWLVIIGCNYQDSGTSLRSSWRVWSPYSGADGFRATNENLNTDSHRDSKADTNTTSRGNIWGHRTIWLRMFVVEYGSENYGQDQWLHVSSILGRHNWYMDEIPHW